MSVNIRFPNITANNEKEQIAQIKSYLHQLVEQLNYALPNLGTGGVSTQTTSNNTYEVQGGEVNYYDLRSLIVQELQKVERMIEDLERAKENGEFDGYTPVKGIDYFDGQDGQPGKDGADGHTPVKGVDYFTEAETIAVAKQAAEKILFTLDENGNLYYEVEE